MKKTLLTFVFVLSCIVSFAQSRLGSTPYDILTEFPPALYGTQTGYDSEGDYYILIRFDHCYAKYYFDADNRCCLTFIFPHSQGDLNFYVEEYNKKYVIVSNTEWKMYSANGISSVKLVYTDDGRYFFRWIPVYTK